MAKSRKYVEGQIAGLWPPPAVQAVVTPDDLRRALIDDINYVLDRPRLRVWLTDQQIRLLRAQRSYWTDAEPQAVAQLFARFATIAAQDEEEKKKAEATPPSPKN